MAFIFWRDIARPVEHLPALRTAYFQQFPMHMNHIGIARAFMQVIDILRHQQKVIARGRLAVLPMQDAQR